MKLQNYRLIRQEHKVYQKDGYRVIRDHGRWGPKWLHRIVYRVAMNLGMISNSVMESVIYSTQREARLNDDIKTTIDKALKECDYLYNKWNLPREPFMIVMGYEAFDDFLHVVQLESPSLYFDISIGDKRCQYEYRGVPVYIVPGLEGYAVLPQFGKIPDIEWSVTMEENNKFLLERYMRGSYP